MVDGLKILRGHALVAWGGNGRWRSVEYETVRGLDYEQNLTDGGNPFG